MNYDDTKRRHAPPKKVGKKGSKTHDSATVVTGPTIETSGSDSEDDVPRSDYNNPAKDTSQNEEREIVGGPVEEDRLDLRVAWGSFLVHHLVINIRIQTV